MLGIFVFMNPYCHITSYVESLFGFSRCTLSDESSCHLVSSSVFNRFGLGPRGEEGLSLLVTSGPDRSKGDDNVCLLCPKIWLIWWGFACIGGAATTGSGTIGLTPAAKPASPTRDGWWCWCWPDQAAIEAAVRVPWTDTGGGPVSPGSGGNVKAGCRLAARWLGCSSWCEEGWLAALWGAEAAEVGRPPADSGIHWPPAASQRPGFGGRGRTGVIWLGVVLAGGGGGLPDSECVEFEDDNPGLGSGELRPSSPRLALLSLRRVRSSGGESTSNSRSSSSSSSSWWDGGESGRLVPTPPFILKVELCVSCQGG